MTTVLVTGGTGALGRQVVERLADSGAGVRVLSRRTDAPVPEGVGLVRGDLISGRGLDDALAGVEAVVHCASDPRRLEVEIDGTPRLLDAAKGVGSPHVIYVSIVGVDRIPFGYYQAKLAAETVLRDSGLPWTILRATQFHDLVLQGLAALARSPVVPLPRGIRAQPVDTRDVADRLATLALGGSAGRVPDVGGPRVERAEDLLRVYTEAAGLRRRVVSVPAPGRMMRAFRAGANLVEDGDLGTRTFEEFVREQVRPGKPVRLTYYRRPRR
ncbi:MAG: NAD(P)H-binding protein [Streptosporangiales bacterium]|nr:NAD(P)H-binding protein [Streptosporangiales bacterium]